MCYRAVESFICSTFDDFRTGLPVRKTILAGSCVSCIYPGLPEASKAATGIKPAFASLDGAALAFINAAGPTS